MIVYSILLILLVIVSILLIAIILMQSSEGGISSAIGGASQITTAFGSQTPSILIKATTVLAIIFGLLIVGMNVYSIYYSGDQTKSVLIKHAEEAKTVQPLNLYEGEEAAQNVPNDGNPAQSKAENPFPGVEPAEDSGK